MSHKQSPQSLRNISNDAINTNIQYPHSFDDIANYMKKYQSSKVQTSLLNMNLNEIDEIDKIYHPAITSTSNPLPNTNNGLNTSESSMSSLPLQRRSAPIVSSTNVQQISAYITRSNSTFFNKQITDGYREFLHTQYTHRKQNQYKQAIAKTLESLGFNVTIVDEISAPSNYIHDLQLLFSQEKFVSFDYMLSTILPANIEQNKGKSLCFFIVSQIRSQIGARTRWKSGARKTIPNDEQNNKKGRKKNKTKSKVITKKRKRKNQLRASNVQSPYTPSIPTKKQRIV
eukprot:365819_1